MLGPCVCVAEGGVFFSLFFDTMYDTLMYLFKIVQNNFFTFFNHFHTSI